MMMWQPKTLHEVLAPVFWLNWLLGLGIFEIPDKHPQLIFSMVYGLLISLGYFSMFIGALSYVKTHLPLSSKMIFVPMLSINVLVAVVSVVNGWSKVNALRLVKDRFVSLDRTLLRLGMANLHKEAAKHISIYLVLWLVVMVLLGTADYIWTTIEFRGRYTLYFTFVTLIPIAQNFIVDFTFAVLVRGVLRRVKVLNDLSSETMDYLNIKRYTDFDQSHGFRRITVAMRMHSRNHFMKQYIAAAKQVHLETVRLANLVNAAYSTVLLFELAVTFSIIIGCLFQLYMGVSKMGTRNSAEIIQLVTIVTWVVMFSLKVVGINYACSSFEREVNVTAQILRDFNRLHADEDLRDQIQQFCMQLILRPIYFTAAGFVRLDNDCTRMFFGTVATYLVILMQVSSNPKAVNSLLPPIS